jgi:two-component system, NarL family, response regulator DevR
VCSFGCWHGKVLLHPWTQRAHKAVLRGNSVSTEKKRILLVTDHNVFREALAVRLNQEEDLEVARHAGSLADTRDVHLNGIDVAVVDPLLPDGDGMDLIREVTVANPNALALVLSHKLDPAVYHQSLGAGAVEVLATNIGIEEVINAVRRSAISE